MTKKASNIPGHPGGPGDAAPADQPPQDLGCFRKRFGPCARISCLILSLCCHQALYLLLVTNKASNILEDLETLRLLSKVTPEYVASLDEEAICRAAFDLLFAFDEVISLGYKENVTVAQVKQNTEVRLSQAWQGKLPIQESCRYTGSIEGGRKGEMKREAVSSLSLREPQHSPGACSVWQLGSEQQLWP